MSFDPGMVMVVVNRTTSTVAMSPDLVFEPCSERALTQADIDAALAKESERLTSGAPDDLPAGVVSFSMLAVSRPKGSTFPAVVLIQPDGTRVVFEPFDRATLPACQGVATLKTP